MQSLNNQNQQNQQLGSTGGSTPPPSSQQQQPHPPPPPPPPLPLATTQSGMAHECQGCLAPIHDRYYLLVMERAWHLNCLRCAACKLSLDSQHSCFAKDGFIYCKDDYFK